VIVVALTDELLDAIADVRDGRIKREAKPGAWRVWINDSGAVVVEVYE